MKLPMQQTTTAALAATAITSQISVSNNMNVCISNATNAYQNKILNLASKIQPKILTKTRGSGNFGESGTAAYYTFESLPASLTNNDKTKKNLYKQEIDLGEPYRMAFVIDGVLTNEEADALASCAESILMAKNHSRIAPGINTPPGMRMNEAAHWYPNNKDKTRFLGGIYHRIQHLLPQQLEHLTRYPKLSEKIAQFKYNQGDEFKRHIDGLFPGQGINQAEDGVDEWIGVVSGLSLLFYLNDQENDGLVGGETRLWSADGRYYTDIKPKKGRVLVFRRGSNTAVLHAGLPVVGNVPKYMALINVAYGQHTDSRPLF